jgi:hypothetical protein
MNSYSDLGWAYKHPQNAFRTNEAEQINEAGPWAFFTARPVKSSVRENKGVREKDGLIKMISSLFQIHAKIDWFIKDLFRRIVQPTHEAI